MCAESVIEGKEINLNSIYYPIVGPVEPLPANVYPEKIVTGDTTRDSDPNLSSMIFSDFRGGTGLDVMEGFQTNRCWESSLYLRKAREITLAPLWTETTDENIMDGFPILIAHQRNDGTIMTVWGDDLWMYKPASDQYVDTTRNTGDDGGTFDLIVYWDAANEIEYIIVSKGTGYDYRDTSGTDTAAFTSSTQDADRFVLWDDRLWGISYQDSRSFWYAFVPGTETVLSKPPADFDFLRAIWVGPLVSGETAIHVLTFYGLWVYDAANDRWIDLQIFAQSEIRAGQIGLLYEVSDIAATWRFKHYIAAGSDLIVYDPFGQTVRIEGPGQPDGFSPFHRGEHITAIIPTARTLFLMTGTSATGSGASTGHIYAYDERGWYQVFEPLPLGLGTDHMPIAATVFRGGNLFRLYVMFADGAGSSAVHAIQYIDLPIDYGHPKDDSTFNYAAAGVLKTPWFHADQVDVDKLAVRLKVETSDTSTSGTVESVKIEYAIDYDEGSSDANYLTLGNSTFTDGLIDTDDTGVTVTTFVFPLDTVDLTVAPVGKVFKAIRFKVSLARGGTTTNSPRLISMTLEYRKKLTYKRSYRMIIDMSKFYKGLEVGDLRSAFNTVEQLETLAEFTFRENDSMYVDVYREAGQQETGFTQKGLVAIKVVEA